MHEMKRTTPDLHAVAVHGDATAAQRPVVAHVNYLFFQSTQGFIYFYLSHLKRVRPICLTREPESPTITATLPRALADDFYQYGHGTSQRGLTSVIWSTGLKVRHALTRLPAPIATALLGQLFARVVPWLRSDSDPAEFVDWAESIVRRRDARIVHAYFGPIGWRMLELKRRLGLPLVVTLLGDDVGPSISPWWWWWIRVGSEKPDWPARLHELITEADLLLVEGPHLRQKLIAMGCPPEKVAVQRIALPLDEIPFPRERSAANGKVQIVFAGRFCEQKGLLYALEAIRELREERSDFELKLIGDDTLTDGRYAARVRAFIAKHRLQRCVRQVGFLNHADYLRELRFADIFLHPSIIDDEGTSEGGAPTTILEAQALGVPIVSTTHCDIPNVTLPGESALLVAERDSQALAAALRQLLDDPERRERMGRAGRRHMERLHDIKHEAATLDERYLGLLGR
jgi:colanic acid/amylovoran biosynthesis glycosyltransferase